MDSDHAVGVGFREGAQLVDVGFDESGAALAEDAEDFRRFHPDFVICIVQ